MCAVGRHCVKAILGLDEQDLAALDAFDLILSLLAVLEVDAGQALELVFGSHVAEGAGEAGLLDVQVCWQLCNRLTEEMRCVTEGGEHRRKDVWRYSGWGGGGGVGVTLKATTAVRCQLARHDMGLGCVGVECLRADDDTAVEDAA